MNAYVHGGSAAPRKTKRVFLLSGTATEGKAVCYNWDALTVTAENDTLSGNLATNSAADWTDARRTMVEAPSYKNNLHFAGVVDRASDGVIGPNWITVHVPGSVCKVYTGAAVSANIGADQNYGPTRTFTVAMTSVQGADTANGEFNYTGLVGEGTAILLSEGAASVPNDSYLKMAELMVGPPSGGVQTQTLISVDAAASAVYINHGVINLQKTDTAADTNGTISVPNGEFIGQHLLVRGPLAAASVAVNVDFGTRMVGALLSTESLAATPVITVLGVQLSAPTHYCDVMWNGVKWVDQGSAAAAGYSG